MTARVVFVLVWVHALYRMIASNSGSVSPPLSLFRAYIVCISFKRDLGDAWLRVGLVAAVGFTILCLVSLRPVRAKRYEFFFYTHFLLVL